MPSILAHTSDTFFRFEKCSLEKHEFGKHEWATGGRLANDHHSTESGFLPKRF